MGEKWQFKQWNVCISDMTSWSELTEDIGGDSCAWKKAEHLLAAVDVPMENTEGSRHYRGITWSAETLTEKSSCCNQWGFAMGYEKSTNAKGFWGTLLFRQFFNKRYIWIAACVFLSRQTLIWWTKFPIMSYGYVLIIFGMYQNIVCIRM